MKRSISILILATLAIAGQSVRSQDFIVNGIPVSVQRSSVRGMATQLALELQRSWRTRGYDARLMRSNALGIAIVSRQLGSRFESVKFTQQRLPHTVDVVASLTNLRQRPGQLPAQPWHFPLGTRIDSAIESLEHNAAITFTGRSTMGSRGFAAAVQAAARRRGWFPMESRLFAAGEVLKLIWSRGAATATLSIAPQRSRCSFVLLLMPNGRSLSKRVP